MTPTEIGRIEPGDISADVLIARGRRKGRGTRPRALPLTPDGRAALDEFREVGAWGGVSLKTVGAAWRLAKRKAGYGDTDWRPYDLRHTFATVVAQASGDERAVQALLGHTDRKMTQRYTIGSVDERVTRAIAALAGPSRAAKSDRGN